MSVMQWHMLRALVAYTVALAAGLSVLIMIVDPFGLYYLLSSGAMPLDQFIRANLLTVPTVLCQTVPIAAGLATIKLYHRWIGDNEVICMRAAGMTDWSIALPGVLAACLASILAGAMSLFFLAATFPSLSDIVFVAKFAPPLSSLREQQVAEIAPKVSISFMRRSSAAVVKDVTFWDWSNPKKSTYIRAESGTFFTDDWGEFLLLQRGSVKSSVAGRDADDEEPVAFERMTLPLRPKIDLKLRGRGYYEEHVNLLLDPPAKVRNDPVEWRRWTAEAHHRIIIATLCLNYVLLVAGVMISARFQRVGILWRSASLVVVIFALYGLLIQAHVGVIYGVVPLALLYLFAVGPAAIGGYLLLMQSRAAHLAPYCRRVFQAGRALSPSERADDSVGARIDMRAL